MTTKMQLNTKVASTIVERIYEDNIPITITTGEKTGDNMVNVLVECDDEDLFGKLLDETINNLYNLI